MIFKSLTTRKNIKRVSIFFLIKQAALRFRYFSHYKFINLYIVKIKIDNYFLNLKNDFDI